MLLFMKSKILVLALSVVGGVASGGAAESVALPTMGWSSWNTYRVNISEELIKRQADALVANGYAELGYRYVNIDDGWFGGRDKAGRHTTNKKRFPNGLKPVVDHIHAKGLRAGIYSDAGENTCGSKFDNDVLGIGVGLYGHEAEDVKWFFDELGFDFIKIDFCGGTEFGNAAKVRMSERERYTAIACEIDKASKRLNREIRMNVCCWRFPGAWVADIAGSWRMSGDVHASWESVKSIIDKNSFLARFQRPGHYNDMDMLQVGRGMSVEEDKTHFGLWCMMASPLLIGCDLTSVKPETAKLLKNRDLIAIDQDPLGRQAEVVWCDGKRDLRIYAKPLAPEGSRTYAIACYNGSDKEETFWGEFEVIGFEQETLSVWDCFEHKALPDVVRAMEFSVPAHGTRIYRLQPTTSKTAGDEPKRIPHTDTASDPIPARH